MASTSTKIGRRSANQATKGTSRIENITDPAPGAVSSTAPKNVAAATKSGAFLEAKIAGEAHDKLLSRQGVKYASGEGRLVSWPVEAEVIGVILGP